MYIYGLKNKNHPVFFFGGGVDFFTPQKKDFNKLVISYVSRRKHALVGFEGFNFCFHGLLDLEKCLGLDPDDFLQEVGGGWGGRERLVWDWCGDFLKVKIDGACPAHTNFGRWICK